MLWIVIGLLAPACWACGNHIDKYLLHSQQNQRGVGALLLFSAFIGLPALALIWLAQPHVTAISFTSGAILVANGALYVLGLLPYLYALERDEASVVVPLFQTTAVFSYLLGLFVLDEQLTWWQIFASLLVMGGSLLVILEVMPNSLVFKRSILLLMLTASFLNALNWLLFKVVAIHEDFWRSSFWEYVGFVLIGLCFLMIKPYRNECIALFRQGSSRVLSLVTINEILSLVAKTATNKASLLAPLALVSILHGLQPLFVFLYGVALTLYLPRYGSERLVGRVVVQKVVAIVLMTVGTSLLALRT
jgi:drug/metabolite transporter (DMT)-like permease